MPLTKSGKSVLSAMTKEYGAEKGKSVFYASMNAKKKGSNKWHKTSKETYSNKAIEIASKK